MHVIERRWEKIVIISRCNSAFLRAILTNRLSAPVPLETRLVRAKMPAPPLKHPTTGRCEFVKIALKNCSCLHLLIITIFSHLLSITYNQSVSKSRKVVSCLSLKNSYSSWYKTKVFPLQISVCRELYWNPIT